MEYIKANGKLGNAGIFDKNDSNLLSIEKTLEKMYWGFSYESLVKDRNNVWGNDNNEILQRVVGLLNEHYEKINIDIVKWKRNMKKEYDEEFRKFVVQKEPPFEVMGVVRKEDEVT